MYELTDAFSVENPKGYENEKVYMMNWAAISPSLEQLAEYIKNPLWVEFNSRIQSAY